LGETVQKQKREQTSNGGIENGALNWVPNNLGKKKGGGRRRQSGRVRMAQHLQNLKNKNFSNSPPKSLQKSLIIYSSSEILQLFVKSFSHLFCTISYASGCSKGIPGANHQRWLFFFVMC
jgi:hypothetical protein